MRRRIIVTQGDIDTARSQSARRLLQHCCPIAQSLHRQGHDFISVGPYDVAIYDGMQSVRLKLSQQAVAWIDRFDHGEPVEPAIFYAEVVTR